MKQQRIEGNGGVTITEDLPDNPDGSRAVRSWTFRQDQAAAHEKFLGADLSKGDRDALRDVANEAAKRKARGE